MRRRTIVGLVLGGVLSVHAASAEEKAVGVVTGVEGPVTLKRAALPETPVKFKDDVRTWDRITTGNEARARLLLGGKATVTIRERSSVTITDAPHTAFVDVANGAAAVAVLKAKMGPNDRIVIRTANAIAGIRGTVVVAEVTRALHGPRSRITVLRGVVDVQGVDDQGVPVGTGVTLHLHETTTIDGVAEPSRPVAISEQAAKRLLAQFTFRPNAGPTAPATWLIDAEVARAAEAFVSSGTATLGPGSVGSTTSGPSVTEATATTTGTLTDIVGSVSPSLAGTTGSVPTLTGSIPTLLSPATSPASTVIAPTLTVPVTAPTLTIPTLSTPTVTVPSITNPTLTVPTISSPAVTVPAITTPTITVPTTTTPASTSALPSLMRR
jgi:FecR protein